MEIHAPDHPITGWKETAKHLAIITAGVLIALALEGVVSWADHRLLVREAVANLTSEIRANRKELDGMFAGIDKELKELKNAAVTTGQITGAFGYMEYSEVRRYADVYDLQAGFMRLQEREGEKFQPVLGFVRRFADSAPPPPAALEEWRKEISAVLASLTIKEQMARVLLKRYDELLTGK